MNEPRHAELEGLLVKQPDDLVTWQVYADWMLQQGTPRGQLAGLQLLLEQRPEDATLQIREERLLSEHAQELRSPHYGAYTPHADETSSITWRGGFWRTLQYRGPPEPLRVHLEHASARLLHALDLQGPGRPFAPQEYEPLLRALPRLEALRQLTVGDIPTNWPRRSFRTWTVGSLAPLASACPRLERLQLRSLHFAMVDLPKLQHLDLSLGAALPSVRSLAKASLPSLRELYLRCDPRVAWDPDLAREPTLEQAIEVLAPLLGGRSLPALRRLVLAPASLGEPLLQHVRASPLGQRLDKLELSTTEP